MNELEQRAAVLAEARSWLGTPYHSAASRKGVGCDCLQFPAAVYAAVGVIAKPDLPYYPPDWHLHKTDERYLEGVLRVAAAVSEARPGDFALWRIGRALAHGAIVIAWPRIIHAVQGIGVIEDLETPINLRFDRRPRGSAALPHSGGGAAGEREHHFYSPWAKQPPTPTLPHKGGGENKAGVSLHTAIEAAGARHAEEPSVADATRPALEGKKR